MDSACNTDFSSHMLLVLCQDYFSHAEGKKSLVNCLFNFCSMRFKNWWCNVFKFVLHDITQSLKLWKSSNETARGRDHLSRSFQTPKSEDAQNMKPLSTSESPEDNLINIWKLRNFTLPVFKLRNIHCPLTEVLAFFHQCSLVLPGLVSCIVLQLPCFAFFGRHLLQYVMSLAGSNLIGVPPSWCMEQKLNRQLTRLFFPSACEK